ncbi:MAG: enolase C-terminal domain-like protein [Actinomycetota bacterium]
MKITNLKVTTVTVPLEAPLRHASGAHWGRFVRTILEIETDEGITGLGEMGGGGEGAELAFAGLKKYLLGENPFDLEGLRFKICNPTASLYNNRTQLFAAIEFACLDIIGKKLGVPVYNLLGGKIRNEVEFASYLFFRYPNEEDGYGEVSNPEQLVAHAQLLKKKHGFTTHKLKGGVFNPEYELRCFLALGDALPQDRFRFDPNATLSVTQSVEFARAIKHMRIDYLEDFTYGIDGMKKLRDLTRMQTGTNTVVVNFEQLAQNVHREAIDVVLLDTTFWGGIRACIKAAGVCETFQIGVAVHSSGELGIQLATMLHLGAVIPNLSNAADAHYHHLKDDIIKGGLLKYENGKIAVPTGPGLGVELDRDKLNQYAELFKELGGYPYDKDPQRPNWFPLVPNDRWAPVK